MNLITPAFAQAAGAAAAPDFLMTLVPFLQENSSPSEHDIREALSGHLCRCTGYANIVRAVALAAQRAAR